VHLLEVRGLSKFFGGIRALEDVSFSVRPNIILSIIGPNGAGKTTLFNCLTGFMKPSRGLITLDEGDITGLPAERISHMGISRTFQNIRLFRGMSVLDNVMVAQHGKIGYGIVAAVLRGGSYRLQERRMRERAFEHLCLLGLEPYSEKPAGSLAYGLQRRIEIARALATGAGVILLDEPTAGMNPQETVRMTETIGHLKELGKTVLLIEHDMKVVMGISDRVVVLDHGVKIAEGGPEEIRNDQMVIEAYLGREAV